MIPQTLGEGAIRFFIRWCLAISYPFLLSKQLFVVLLHLSPTYRITFSRNQKNKPLLEGSNTTRYFKYVASYIECKYTTFFRVFQMVMVKLLLRLYNN